MRYSQVKPKTHSQFPPMSCVDGLLKTVIIPVRAGMIFDIKIKMVLMSQLKDCRGLSILSSGIMRSSLPKGQSQFQLKLNNTFCHFNDIFLKIQALHSLFAFFARTTSRWSSVRSGSVSTTSQRCASREPSSSADAGRPRTRGRVGRTRGRCRWTTSRSSPSSGTTSSF